MSNQPNFVRVQSDEGRPCPICQQMFFHEKFSEAVEHYISAHDYELVHVGTETESSDEGLKSKTVAHLKPKHIS